MDRRGVVLLKCTVDMLSAVISDGPNWTAYMPMPQRLRATITGDRGMLRDLADLAWPASGASATAAGRALAKHFQDNVEVLLTNSGTSALVLALRHQGVQSGDEVIIASFNCPQVADAVLAAGGRPVLADSEPYAGALDPQSVRELISTRTRCIVLTHQFGLISNTFHEVIDIADAHGIATIDDSAQALGARSGGRQAGQLCDTGVLSFGRTKPTSCFGGGALILPSGARLPMLATGPVPGAAGSAARVGYEQFTRSRSIQFQRALTRLVPLQPLQTDVARALESRSRTAESPKPMHPGTARLLIRKLSHLDATMSARLAAAQRLAQALEGLPLTLPPVGVEEYSASCFSVRLAPQSRFELGEFLSRRGFPTTWVHYPLHRLPKYQQYATGAYAGAEHLWPRNLILPYRRLSPRLAGELGTLIREYFRG